MNSAYFFSWERDDGEGVALGRWVPAGFRLLLVELDVIPSRDREQVIIVRFRSWHKPGDSRRYFVSRTKVLFYVSHVKYPCSRGVFFCSSGGRVRRRPYRVGG